MHQEVFPINIDMRNIIKIVDIKDGIQLDHKCSLDYTRIEDVGSQRLFDSLFEKSLFSDLISDLVNLTYLDIEYSNLREVDYRILQERYDLKRIVWRISNVKFENRKVKSFMDNVNWEHFSIAFIYDLIKSGKTDIVVSEDQKNHIIKYCFDMLSKIDIHKSITYEYSTTRMSHASCILRIFYPTLKQNWIEVFF